MKHILEYSGMRLGLLKCKAMKLLRAILPRTANFRNGLQPVPSPPLVLNLIPKEDCGYFVQGQKNSWPRKRATTAGHHTAWEEVHLLSTAGNYLLIHMTRNGLFSGIRTAILII